MFEIESLPNIFGYSAHCSPTPEEEEITVARPKGQTLTQDTLDQANDWQRFMSDKGFTDIRYSIEDGTVIGAHGSRGGKDHEISAEVRNMLEEA